MGELTEERYKFYISLLEMPELYDVEYQKLFEMD